MKSKRRTSAPSINIDPVHDYGPLVTRTKDGRLEYHGAADIILEDREDISREPDRSGRRPATRGARRAITIAEMCNRGTVTKPMHDAAIRFLDDLSLATGGSGGTLGSDWIRVTPGSRDAMPERQLRAISRVRSIMVRMGLNSDCVLWWVLIGNKTCAEFDRRFRVREGTAIKQLIGSLQTLDNLYNPPSVGR